MSIVAEPRKRREQRRCSTRPWFPTALGVMVVFTVTRDRPSGGVLCIALLRLFFSDRLAGNSSQHTGEDEVMQGVNQIPIRQSR